MAGETSGIRKGMPGIERRIEYEAMLNCLVEEFPVHGVIRRYDVNKIDGATLFDVLNVHPMMIVAGQIVHNPYFQQPEKRYFPMSHHCFITSLIHDGQSM